MKKKMLILAVLVLMSAAFLYLPLTMVKGQTATTSITAVNPSSAVAGEDFTMTVQGKIQTADGQYSILLNEVLLYNGTAVGNTVNAEFTVKAIMPGDYNVTLQDVAANTEASQKYNVVAEGIAAIPMATALILAVAAGISFANMGLNRALITRMIGWHEYRAMQKEIAEYNAQRMAALRAKNEKALEKLKKKDSQIQSMQTKMFKPQLLLLPITAVYFVIWPILLGFFPFPVAYLPGFGAIPFFYWYLICSFFFGTIASRVIGVTPIQ
ncbi:MAG: hypothetical protein NWF00_05025 [Candidatus Bathyarchaeota archaeon]|nr:hypothetical protein [Candidatus Bathyarchaeota archaeon]